MNSNGHTTSVLVQTKYTERFYERIEEIFRRKPSGVLTVHVSQGGIIGVEWTEKRKPEHFSLDNT